jgi:hypothetical protein
MSSSGGCTTTAPNNCGYRISMLPTISPPLLPPPSPCMLRRRTKVILLATKSCATAAMPS